MPSSDPTYLTRWKQTEAGQAYMRKSSKDRSDRNRDTLRHIRSTTPCADCKSLFPYYVMEFDHPNDDKYRSVASLVSSSQLTLLREIAKCEVVCANCHKIRTHTRRQDGNKAAVVA